MVAVLPDSTRKERTQLLGQEIEEIVVEAKRLGIGLDEMLDSIVESLEAPYAGGYDRQQA